jgi:hypothetical protein
MTAYNPFSLEISTPWSQVTRRWPPQLRRGFHLNLNRARFYGESKRSTRARGDIRPSTGQRGSHRFGGLADSRLPCSASSAESLNPLGTWVFYIPQLPVFDLPLRIRFILAALSRLALGASTPLNSRYCTRSSRLELTADSLSNLIGNAELHPRALFWL